MDNNGKDAWAKWLIDGLLLGAVALLLALCLGMVIAWWPLAWGRCLAALDARNWGQWVWTSLGVALLASLLVIRAWPAKKRGGGAS